MKKMAFHRTPLWQNVSARHEDKSYQINKLAYGQDNLFSSDAGREPRDVQQNGRRHSERCLVDVMDDLTTRIGVVSEVGYDSIRKFYMSVKYNPLGICGEGFADRAYTVSPKIAKENGMTGCERSRGWCPRQYPRLFHHAGTLGGGDGCLRVCQTATAVHQHAPPAPEHLPPIGLYDQPPRGRGLRGGRHVGTGQFSWLVQMTFDNLTERSTSTPLQVIVQDRVNGRTHVIHNVILKIHPSSYNVRGFVLQKLEPPVLQNIAKCAYRF